MRWLRLPCTRHAPPGPVPSGDVLAEAEALHVRLGSREVLSGVDVTARAGEVLAPVGPNGAGKSTLLGALAADLPAAEGLVRVHGRPASDWSPHDLGLAAAYAHRVVILCAGRAVADGPPAEVFTDRLLSDICQQPVEVLPPAHRSGTGDPTRGS